MPQDEPSLEVNGSMMITISLSVVPSCDVLGIAADMYFKDASFKFVVIKDYKVIISDMYMLYGTVLLKKMSYKISMGT